MSEANHNLSLFVGAILAKRRYAPKESEKRPKAIPPNMMLNEANKLPIDQLHSTSDRELNKRFKQKE